jgi:hypothetical protein
MSNMSAGGMSGMSIVLFPKNYTSCFSTKYKIKCCFLINININYYTAKFGYEML